MNTSNMTIGALGAQRAAAAEKSRYLSFQRRGLWGQASYNIGYSYFGGLLLGGLFGFVHGVRTSPNPRPRIVLNSVLNSCGKYGAKTGNALGVLSLLYTVTERQLEDVELDKLPHAINRALGVDLFGRRHGHADVLIPAASAFLTGALFSLPRASTWRRAGVVSAVVVVAALVAGVGPAVVGLVAPALFSRRRVLLPGCVGCYHEAVPWLVPFVAHWRDELTLPSRHR
jgi:hypothetical protein